MGFYRPTAGSLGGSETFTGEDTYEADILLRETGDSNPRLRLNHEDGKLEWGSGSGAADVTLYRGAAGVLQTDDTVLSERSAAGDDAFQAQVSGDSNPRFVVNADGKLEWGDGSGAVDTNLYRVGGSVLGTDDNFGTGSIAAVPGQLRVKPNNSSTIGQVIRLAAGQTANALEVQNSGGSPLFSIDENGAITELNNVALPVAIYAPSNVTTDRTYDANSTTLDEVADVLGTLIADLQSIGILGS